MVRLGLPRWRGGKESACQCRRSEFNPWVRKIPWSEKWQPTPVFLFEKLHERRSLVGYVCMGSQRGRQNWAHVHRHTNGEANRLQDACIEKIVATLTNSNRRGAPSRGRGRGTDTRWIPGLVRRSKGKCGQEPSSWFLQEVTGETG